MHTNHLRPTSARARRFVVALVSAVLVAPTLALAPAGAVTPARGETLDAGRPVTALLPEDPTLPDPCDSPVPVPGVDCVPPVTTITQKPAVVAGRTRGRAATFAFAAFEDEAGTTPDTTATFECRLAEPNEAVPTAYQVCTSPTAYGDLGDGQHTFAVRAVDEAGNTDESPETFTWTVDTTAPETTITSGPGRWVLATSARFGLSSSEAGSSFRCELDDFGRFCSPSGASVGFSAGTHTLTASAEDAVGNEDPTPASRTFTMPRDDRDLTRSSGWKQGKGTGYFLNTFTSTTKKGASLRTSAASVRSIALVVTKGRGHGVVKVYLGATLLKKVSLAADTTRKKQLVTIASFPTARTGRVTVLVASRNKQVVVEGLGIATG